MKKIIITSIILISSLSCNTRSKISHVIDKQTYIKEFKKETFKRCMLQKSKNEFHENIFSDLYKHLPPPPPFYIKQSISIIDSMVLFENTTPSVIENCVNITQSQKIEKMIKNEYKKVLIKDKNE